MIKETKKITINIKTTTYEKLKELTNTSKQTITNYIENLIEEKNINTKNNVKEIRNILKIIQRHNRMKNGLQTIFSNLNEITYNTHINEIQNSKNILKLIKENSKLILENIKIDKEINKEITKKLNKLIKVDENQ